VTSTNSQNNQKYLKLVPGLYLLKGLLQFCSLTVILSIKEQCKLEILVNIKKKV